MNLVGCGLLWSSIIARFEEYANWLYFLNATLVILGGLSMFLSLLPDAERKPDPWLREIINILKKEDPNNLLPLATLMAIILKPDEPETDVLRSAMMELLQNGIESSRPSY
ncbi:unnamed protein product [Arabis nemorensis]|uniref:Uncharacterized protein n=1 Tax=Arabis nemorensis TaxID=586526 RepID=A0A565AMX4_9BRAS|nr:unnamed protein product [Arabis nemorensis]